MADPLLELISGRQKASGLAPAVDPLLALINPASSTGQQGSGYVPAGRDLSAELFGDAPPRTGRDLSAELFGDAAAPSGFGASLNASIADVPRQLGLTARHAIEGVGGALDFMASPIRTGMNALLPDQYAIKPGVGTTFSDAVGLPAPRNPMERVVGDASRMMVGAALPIAGASKLAQGAVGVPKTIMEALAANPAQQVASAGSAGAAAGTVKETGGNELSQTAAAVAAGVATPFAMNSAQRLGNWAGAVGHGMMDPSRVAQTVDAHIDNALRNSGITLADIPENVKASLRQDVAQALRAGDNLSPDAMRRLADYRLTNTTPTAATLTLDPAMVSQQKNLAKIGINSKDAAAQQLGQVENANNRQLITGLNNLGASTSDDALAGGQKIMGALSARNDAAKAIIDQRYAAARAANGRSAALDPAAFTQSANDALDQALLGGKLPSDVRNLLNKVATGKTPLTVDVAEQFKTRIGELQRATTDMAERKALGLVRQSLDNTPLLDGAGKEAVDAFGQARRLNRAWMNIVERTPALQAVRDGMEPDKFVQQFIVGNGTNANTMDLAMLKRSVKSNPEAMGAIKDQITAYLKGKALNGAADEVGNFSQSAYNKALNAIGDRKLGMFFAPDEVNQLRAIGRVASYEQFQPRGAAVNNSNTTGSAITALMNWAGNSALLSKIPLHQAITEPAKNFAVGRQAKQAMNVPRGLLAPEPAGYTQPPAGLLMSPAALMPLDDDRRRGLLAP